MNMFTAWRSTAERVEHALTAHEGAVRAGDARLAQAVESGFRARRWGKAAQAQAHVDLPRGSVDRSGQRPGTLIGDMRVYLDMCGAAVYV